MKAFLRRGVSPLGMKRLRGLSTAVADAADKTAGDVDTRGWRRVTIPIESVDHAAGQMLRLGPEAQVLRPAALRKKLVETIAAMAVLYDA